MPRIHWLIGAFLVAACTYDLGDPFQRPGTFKPLGANDANLRVMVANPDDLLGQSVDNTIIGAEAAPPITRLLAGKRYPLPALNATSIGGGSQQAPPPGAANPGTSQ